FRTGEHLGRCGVEGDLAAGAEAGEIDDADGAGVLVGDEAVSEEALGFGPGTGRGGSGGEEQGAPRNQGRVHSAILSRGGVKRAAHVILEKARQSTRRRDGRVVEGARLESVFRGNSNVGSNPTLSASIKPAATRPLAAAAGSRWAFQGSAGWRRTPARARAPNAGCSPASPGLPPRHTSRRTPATQALRRLSALAIHFPRWRSQRIARDPLSR